MNVGQLFVSLGVKGADNALKGIGGVKKGLKDTHGMSLQAKAAIVGVVFGLERMMSHSMRTGKGLKDFALMTGMSAEALQKWQHAGRQVAIQGESITQSFRGVQQSIGDLLMGRGQIEGIGLVQQVVDFDPMEAQKDIEYAMRKLQEFALNAQYDETTVNAALRSFGLTDEVIAGMREAAFQSDKMQGANILSDKEVDRLREAQALWSQMWHDVQMTTARIFAQDGENIVGDVREIAQSVMELVTSLHQLSQTLNVFQAIGKIVEGWSGIFSGLNTLVEAIYDPETRQALNEGAALFSGQLQKDASAVMGQIRSQRGDEMFGGSSPSNMDQFIFGRPQPQTQDINVNQNLNFQHAGENASEVARDSSRAIEEAFRQINQGAVN